MRLEKYSIGVGDRFAHQGSAQLRALMMARGDGVEVVPVWNKSHREHMIIHTDPGTVREEADQAVKNSEWDGSYYVDADHIGLKNVDLFIDASDFFTLDVADFIGEGAVDDDVNAFVEKYSKYTGSLSIPGIDHALEVSREELERIARKYLLAIKCAGKIYKRIESVKDRDDFITEVSMDETDEPQSPTEMFFILAAIADEGIPAQTIAPKFSGRFNKGVDYVGDVAAFEREFDEDVAVVGYCREEFGLPSNLKLSVHSGSDKFSIYGSIGSVIARHDAGLHLKTAGTTWLEELIGLAEGGGDGLVIAREVYAQALSRFDELCGPYATVIDIDRAALPSADEVNGWGGERYVAALRHDQDCPDYDSNLRQLLHVGYKVAAEMGDRYTDALVRYEETVAHNVTENIYERHLCRIFGL